MGRLEKKHLGALSAMFAVATLWLATGEGARAARPEATAWQMSSDQSRIYVQVFKKQGTLGSGFAHDHVIRATNWSGNLQFDPDHPNDCSLSLTVPVNQLQVDEPSMRRRVGYSDMLSQSDRDKVRHTMLSQGQLDANQYPNITIHADDCQAQQDDHTYQVHVTVDAHGHQPSRTTTVHVTTPSQGQMHVDGRFEMQHSDFGIQPYSAFFGAVQNAQRIRFVAHVVASRSGG